MAVRIVALVSTKGGAGKSTLAECLAVAAAKEGQSVYLLDLDPPAKHRRLVAPQNGTGQSFAGHWRCDGFTGTHAFEAKEG